jgi:hypothetical protein
MFPPKSNGSDMLNIRDWACLAMTTAAFFWASKGRLLRNHCSNKHDAPPRPEFHHVNHIMPAIYEILRIKPPEMVKGFKQDTLARGVNNNDATVITCENTPAVSMRHADDFAVFESASSFSLSQHAVDHRRSGRLARKNAFVSGQVNLLLSRITEWGYDIQWIEEESRRPQRLRFLKADALRRFSKLGGSHDAQGGF